MRAVTINSEFSLPRLMGQAALIKSVEEQTTQLAERLANIEGEKQYLEQHVVQLEAKIGEQNEKIIRLDKESQEMKGQLSSIEGDNQYLQQQLTESETKVGKLDGIHHISTPILMATRCVRMLMPMAMDLAEVHISLCSCV